MPHPGAITEGALLRAVERVAEFGGGVLARAACVEDEGEHAVPERVRRDGVRQQPGPIQS